MTSMLTPQQSFTSVESLGSSGCSSSASDIYGDVDLEPHIRSLEDMLRELINYVESIEFDVGCGLASGTTMFKRILDDDTHVQRLVELCKDRATAIFILGHMLDLALRKFDNRYRNPL